MLNGFKLYSRWVPLFILCDHVRNSHSHSVLKRIDISKEKFDPSQNT